VLYDITVTNNGDADSTSINAKVIDDIPAGLTLADDDWTEDANGLATYNKPVILAPGATEVLTIAFTVDAGISGIIKNIACV
jgi:uncharacterized repeat protein (TIGR01451 family)